MNNLTDKEKAILIQIIDVAPLQGTPDQLRQLLEMIDGIKAKLTAVSEPSVNYEIGGANMMQSATSAREITLPKPGETASGYRLDGAKRVKYEVATT